MSSICTLTVLATTRRCTSVSAMRLSRNILAPATVLTRSTHSHTHPSTRAHATTHPHIPIHAAPSSTPAAAAAPGPPPVPVRPADPAPSFLRMPTIEGVGKCRLLRWNTQPGESYEQGHVLCEIDSDMAVIEFKAQSHGMLAVQSTAADERVSDGQIIGVQVNSAEEIPHAKLWYEYTRAVEKKETAELEAQKQKDPAKSS